ncbi:MAG: HEAT repeat domain-containing protein [Candidatus Omnitrophota bacterium]
MVSYAHTRKVNPVFKTLCAFIAFTFLFTTLIPPSYAQTLNLLNLPVPGAMVAPSPAFMPVLLEGMTIHPDNPLAFDFIIAEGNAQFSKDKLKAETEKLVKYFLASMTIPKDDLWVNLSPHEKDRIIPEALGKTELGRDMLAQDYILKQLTASLVHPEKDLGKKFWDKIYKMAREKYGTTDIPVDTFNKVWILPEKAVVYESGNTVYIVETKLKVMLDVDFVAQQQKSQEHKSTQRSSAVSQARVQVTSGDLVTGDVVTSTNNLSSQIIREIILPEIEREVNEGKNFAPLRQIYNSLILAKWYKETIKEGLLSKAYADKKLIDGVDIEDKEIKDKIYARYMEAYKKGVYDYIREDYDEISKQPIPRKYFSGGEKLNTIPLQSADPRTAELALREKDATGGQKHKAEVEVKPQREKSADTAEIPKKDSGTSLPGENYGKGAGLAGLVALPALPGLKGALEAGTTYGIEGGQVTANVSIGMFDMHTMFANIGDWISSPVGFTIAAAVAVVIGGSIYAKVRVQRMKKREEGGRVAAERLRIRKLIETKTKYPHLITDSLVTEAQAMLDSGYDFQVEYSPEDIRLKFDGLDVVKGSLKLTDIPSSGFWPSETLISSFQVIDSNGEVRTIFAHGENLGKRIEESYSPGLKITRGRKLADIEAEKAAAKKAKREAEEARQREVRKLIESKTDPKYHHLITYEVIAQAQLFLDEGSDFGVVHHEFVVQYGGEIEGEGWNDHFLYPSGEDVEFTFQETIKVGSNPDSWNNPSYDRYKYRRKERIPEHLEIVRGEKLDSSSGTMGLLPFVPLAPIAGALSDGTNYGIEGGEVTSQASIGMFDMHTMFANVGEWVSEHPVLTIAAAAGLLWLKNLISWNKVSGLIRHLGDKSSENRKKAAQRLGEKGDKRAVEPLIERLEDAEYAVRSSAAEALGKLGDKRAVEPLLERLSDYEYVRRYAAEALGELGDQRAVEPLIERLTDHESFVRRSAAEALGKLGDNRAVKPLIGMLKNSDSSVCRSAVEALRKLDGNNEYVKAWMLIKSKLDPAHHDLITGEDIKRTIDLNGKITVHYIPEEGYYDPWPGNEANPWGGREYRDGEWVVNEYQADWRVTTPARIEITPSDPAMMGTSEKEANEIDSTNIKPAGDGGSSGTMVPGEPETEPPGGIDMNEIEVERQGSGVTIKFDPAQVQNIIDKGITGFTPVIINIVPIPSILPLLGLAPAVKEEEMELSKS